jgi:hypothetical protein
VNPQLRGGDVADRDRLWVTSDPRRSDQSAGVDVSAGTTVIVLNGAVHRDPRRFDDPPTFEVAPSNVRRPRAARFIVWQHG